MSPPTAASAPTKGALWRNGDFLLLWSGESISLLGSRVSVLAIPSVAILAFDTGPGVVGVLVALQWLPFLLFGSLVGVWIDRWPRKRVMTATNTGRAALTALIPIAYWLDVLALWQLYVLAALMGILTVFFQVAFRAYLPTVLKREEFIEGNAKLQLSQAVAQVAGTPIAGVLIGWLGAAVAIIVDAVSYVAAALCLTGIRRKEPAMPPSPAAARGARGTLEDLRAGLRVTWDTLVLRNLAAMAALGNIALSMASAVVLVYLYHDLDLSPASVGAALGIGSIGFLLGAMASQPLSRSLGIGPTLLLCSFLLGAGYLVLPLASVGAPLVVVAVSQFLAALQAGPVNVGLMTLVQSNTPPQMMGRVTGVSLTFVWGGNALGGVLGGALGAAVGNQWALAVSGLVGLLSAVFVLGPVMAAAAPPARPVAPSAPTAASSPAAGTPAAGTPAAGTPVPAAGTPVPAAGTPVPAAARSAEEAVPAGHTSWFGSHLPMHILPIHLPWHFSHGPAISRIRSFSHVGGAH